MMRSLLSIALLAALPFAASAAEGISYDYVEGGYSATNFDAVSVGPGVDTTSADAEGLGVNASVAIHPNFHVFGGYQRQKIVDGIDYNQGRIGLGYNRALNQSVDLVARVAYESADIDAPFGGPEADGASAEAGVRGALGKHVEGYAYGGYAKWEDSDGDFYGRVGAQVKFNSSWGVGADVKFNDSGDAQYFVGPRFSW